MEIPADEKARELGNAKAANIVMLGAILKETGVVKPDSIRHQMEKMFSGRKAKFLPLNQAAFDLYLTYKNVLPRPFGGDSSFSNDLLKQKIQIHGRFDPRHRTGVGILP